MKQNKKASAIVYVMIVLFLAMIIGYVVLGKTSILTNNLSLGINSQELYTELFRKGNIAIDSVKKYNSNGGQKFGDVISCPSDVRVKTASGYWEVSTYITKTEGSIYCKGNYDGEEFRVFFADSGDENKYFTKVYKDGEVRNLERVVQDDILSDSGNQIGNSDIKITSSNNSDISNLKDGKPSTIFSIVSGAWEKYINIKLPNKKIERIVLKKPIGEYYSYRYIITYSDNTTKSTPSKLFPSWETERELDFLANNFTKDIKNIKLETTSFINNLYISELEIYTYKLSGQKPMWTISEDFEQGKIKSISFNSNGVSIPDGIDDDLNSDNYKVTSIGEIYYPNGYQDDDVVPRLTFFGGIKPNKEYYNIFWNNYKTDEYIKKNTNNNDKLNIKSQDAEKANFYLDLYTPDLYSYDMKILEFDKGKYKSQNTLLPIKSYYGQNLENSKGFIHYSSGNLFVGEGKGTGTLDFDLKNSNYAIFIKNNSSSGSFLNYKLTAETNSGTKIYINPIDDSGTGTIEVLTNHIITGLEKNYVGDNFKVVGDKPGFTNGISDFKPKTCLEVLEKDNSLKNQNGYYILYLDGSTPTSVYCDMTTSGGGWTRYVNIKGNYSFQNAKDCWLGKNINNENLECFNPNRYGIAANQLMNNDWSGQYVFDIPTANVGAKVETQTTGYGWRCLGHNDYMIIMNNSGSEPKADASNVPHIWLGKSYCKYGRNPGAISSSYMNYDTATTFGTNFGANREPNAKPTKLYFREAKSSNSILDLSSTKIEGKTIKGKSGGAWNNGTYATSCNEYKNPKGGYTPSNGDGLYFIDSDGDGGKEAFLVYCDMTTDGGGWTKLYEWGENPAKSDYIAGDFSGGEEILMTYKRKNNATNQYAIKITQMKTKQCGQEHTTVADYVDNLLTGSWGYCPRETTNGDYNDIKTEKIIEGNYVDDICINGTLHKSNARNFSWNNIGGRGDMTFRVSDTTVLMGPKGNGSSRCAGVIKNESIQNEVTTWVR